MGGYISTLTLIYGTVLCYTKWQRIYLLIMTSDHTDSSLNKIELK